MVKKKVVSVDDFKKCFVCCLRLPLLLFVISQNVLWAGTAYGELLVKPSFQVNGTFISNPENTPDILSPQEDYIASLTPDLSIKSIKSSYDFSFLGGADAKLYRKKSSSNYITYNGQMAINKKTSQVNSFSFSNNLFFSKNSDSLSDSYRESGRLENEQLSGLEIERTGRLSNSLSLNWDHTLSVLSSLGLSVSENFLFNERKDLIDTRTDSMGLSYRYQWGKGTTLSTGYKYSNNSFDAYEYSFNTSEEGGNIGHHSTDFGFSTKLSSTMKVNMSGGYFISEGKESLGGLTAEAGFRMNQKMTTYQLGYSRDVTNTRGLTKEININESINGAFYLTPNHLIQFSLSGSRTSNRSEPTAKVETRLTSATTDLRWTPSQWLSVSVYCTGFRSKTRLNFGVLQRKESYEAGLNFDWMLTRFFSMGVGGSHFQQWTEDSPYLAVSREMVFVKATATPLGWKL